MKKTKKISLLVALMLVLFINIRAAWAIHYHYLEMCLVSEYSGYMYDEFDAFDPPYSSQSSSYSITRTLSVTDYGVPTWSTVSEWRDADGYLIPGTDYSDSLPFTSALRIINVTWADDLADGLYCGIVEWSKLRVRVINSECPGADIRFQYSGHTWNTSGSYSATSTPYSYAFLAPSGCGYGNPTVDYILTSQTVADSNYAFSVYSWH
jgi:hypothetical protein